MLNVVPSVDVSCLARLRCVSGLVSVRQPVMSCFAPTAGAALVPVENTVAFAPSAVLSAVIIAATAFDRLLATAGSQRHKYEFSVAPAAYGRYSPPLSACPRGRAVSLV